MDEIITEEHSELYTPYEQACSRCIDDLYHTAYLVLVDADAAEKLVTEICVAGVHKYDHLEDEGRSVFALLPSCITV